MSFTLSVILLSLVTAIVCVVPGTFLMLRQQAMLIDAMSHAVLPGIVIGAIVTGQTNSPVMIVFASLMGITVVLAADKFRETKLLAGDANQGVVFPFLFAIGVLLLSTTLKHVHICQDTILTGDLNLMALSSEHVYIGNYDFGPQTMWSMLLVGVLNGVFLLLARRVLVTGTFDREFAQVIGFPVRAVELLFMLLVALTVVSAFNTAGAILVIALMIVPPAGARLMTNNVNRMIVLSFAIAAISALSGFYVAYSFDLATSPTMACVDGLIFLGIAVASQIRKRMKPQQKVF